MILLGTGYSEDIVVIILLLSLLLSLFFLLNRRRLFKILAKVNKLIIPTMLAKDLSNLNRVDKIVIAYRYWVTNNSL